MFRVYVRDTVTQLTQIELLEAFFKINHKKLNANRTTQCELFV